MERYARTWSQVLPLAHHVAAWRGQINPRTYRLTTPLDLGRADLMALLIRRMAADHYREDTAAGGNASNRSGQP